MTDTDILAFLKARLDEDEQTALAAGETDPERCWRFDDERRTCKVIDGTGDTVVYDEGSPNEGQAAHIVRHDPSRVLREVAAKRKILAEHGSMEERMSWDEYWTVCGRCRYDQGLDVFTYPCPTVRALASIWTAHPDYNPSWSIDG